MQRLAERARPAGQPAVSTSQIAPEDAASASAELYANTALVPSEPSDCKSVECETAGNPALRKRGVLSN